MNFSQLCTVLLVDCCMIRKERGELLLSTSAVAALYYYYYLVLCEKKCVHVFFSRILALPLSTRWATFATRCIHIGRCKSSPRMDWLVVFFQKVNCTMMLLCFFFITDSIEICYSNETVFYTKNYGM